MEDIIIKGLIKKALMNINASMLHSKGLFDNKVKFQLSLEEGMATNQHNIRRESVMIILSVDKSRFPVAVVELQSKNKLLAYKTMINNLLTGSIKIITDESITYLIALQKEKALNPPTD